LHAFSPSIPAQALHGLRTFLPGCFKSGLQPLECGRMRGTAHAVAHAYQQRRRAQCHALGHKRAAAVGQDADLVGYEYLGLLQRLRPDRPAAQQRSPGKVADGNAEWPEGNQVGDAVLIARAACFIRGQGLDLLHQGIEACSLLEVRQDGVHCFRKCFDPDLVFKGPLLHGVTSLKVEAVRWRLSGVIQIQR
jgi:hypothetical protein